MSDLYLSTYEMMRLGAYLKLILHHSCDSSWWNIADCLYEGGLKIKIVFTYYSEVEQFEEYPPTKDIIKKYIEDRNKSEDDESLMMEAFLFESEKDKLAFLLKWS